MKHPKLTILNANPGIETSEGETIEQAVERLVNNNEPVEGQAPLIYTERKEGIRADMNIRTDRWEIAVDAMDKVSRSYKARRAERIEKGETNKDDGKPESMQATPEAKPKE